MPKDAFERLVYLYEEVQKRDPNHYKMYIYNGNFSLLNNIPNE